MRPLSLSVQDLRVLSVAQLADLAALRVTERQEFLGGSFTESLDAWQNGPPEQMLGLCFLFHGHPVGMTLFKRPPLSPDWVSEDAASIHGLKIALPWQGRRWGHEAFRLAVRELQQKWPQTRTLMLAVDAENTAALAVYRGYGMADSGPVFDGNHGKEHRLTISLAT